MMALVKSQEPQEGQPRPKPDLTQGEVAYCKFIRWLIEHGRIADDPLHEDKRRETT